MGQQQADFSYKGEPQSPYGVEEKETGRVQEDDIDPSDVEAAVQARLPLDNNPRKASYLSYRASGFTVREACNLAEIRFASVMRWRREDEKFQHYEANIHELQKSLSQDVLRAEFTRNMRLALKRDFKVLYRAVYDFEGLSSREWEYLKAIRGQYRPADMIALEKATAPDYDDGKVIHADSLTVVVDQRVVDDEASRRAAARDLLSRFQKNQRLLGVSDQEAIIDDGEDPVEGEVVDAGNTD